MSFKFDLFSTDSYKYSQCRPSYPAEIFDKIVENTPNRKVVVDVGCGTGQACIQLSSYFDRVIGVEPSQNQLEHAIEHYKVDYINAPAENITLSDKRADAITVAAAFHWFDHELFFKEAKRILKEDGTLAVWSYSTNNTFDSEVATQGMYNINNGILKEYWNDRVSLNNNKLRDVEFPFGTVKRYDISHSTDMSIRDYIQYMSTWSAMKAYNEKNDGNAFLQEMEQRMMDAYQTTDPELEIKVNWPIYLIICKE